MGRGRRFGRNEGQRHSMTHTESVTSQGETAQTNARNARTAEEQQMYESQAEMCERMAEIHRKLRQ